MERTTTSNHEINDTSRPASLTIDNDLRVVMACLTRPLLVQHLKSWADVVSQPSVKLGDVKYHLLIVESALLRSHSVVVQPSPPSFFPRILAGEQGIAGLPLVNLPAGQSAGSQVATIS